LGLGDDVWGTETIITLTGKLALTGTWKLVSVTSLKLDARLGREIIKRMIALGSDAYGERNVGIPWRRPFVGRWQLIRM
jgi:hypothetical protein